MWTTSQAQQRCPGGVVAYVLGEDAAHGLEVRTAVAAVAAAGLDLRVDEGVGEVAVEDDHHGEGAAAGGRRGAPHEDEDGVRQAGEAKLGRSRTMSGASSLGVRTQSTHYAHC